MALSIALLLIGTYVALVVSHSTLVIFFRSEKYKFWLHTQVNRSLKSDESDTPISTFSFGQSLKLTLQDLFSRKDTNSDNNKDANTVAYSPENKNVHMKNSLASLSEQKYQQLMKETSAINVTEQEEIEVTIDAFEVEA